MPHETGFCVAVQTALLSTCRQNSADSKVSNRGCRVHWRPSRCRSYARKSDGHRLLQTNNSEVCKKSPRDYQRVEYFKYLNQNLDNDYSDAFMHRTKYKRIFVGLKESRCVIWDGAILQYFGVRNCPGSCVVTTCVVFSCGESSTSKELSLLDEYLQK